MMCWCLCLCVCVISMRIIMIFDQNNVFGGVWVCIHLYTLLDGLMFRFIVCVHFAQNSITSSVCANALERPRVWLYVCVCVWVCACGETRVRHLRPNTRTAQISVAASTKAHTFVIYSTAHRTYVAHRYTHNWWRWWWWWRYCAQRLLLLLAAALTRACYCMMMLMCCWWLCYCCRAVKRCVVQLCVKVGWVCAFARVVVVDADDNVDDEDEEEDDGNVGTLADEEQSVRSTRTQIIPKYDNPNFDIQYRVWLVCLLDKTREEHDERSWRASSTIVSAGAAAVGCSSSRAAVIHTFHEIHPTNLTKLVCAQFVVRAVCVLDTHSRHTHESSMYFIQFLSLCLCALFNP